MLDIDWEHSPLLPLDLHRRPLAAGRAMARALAGQGPQNPTLAGLVNGFVRLVDQACHQYDLARQHYQCAIDTGDLPPYFLAAGHIEYTLDAMHRALLYLSRLQRGGVLLRDGSPVVDPNVPLSVLSTDARKRINDARDAVHHMDQWLAGGDISATTPAGVLLERGGITIDTVVVRYSEIASWLRQLYAVADRLWQLPSAAVPPSSSEA